MAATDKNVENIEPPTKKILLENGNIDKKQYDDSLKDLSVFIPHKIINNNSSRKTVWVLGKFEGKEGNSLVCFEKTAFTDAVINDKDDGYFTSDSILKNNFINDIYSSYECFPKVSINGLKTTIIYPATNKHIEKYSVQTNHIINETAELYKTITLPHITQEQFTLEWVYNILDHKSESERIVFEDSDEENGFILLPDLKWDGKSLETLHLLALIRKKDIKSLRDLNTAHLPLLKNIFEKGTKIIEDKFHLPPSQQRIYLHYQPSFYHLHVHFTSLKHEAPGINAGKCHLLSTVINNIEISADYYQKATIPFYLRENDSLFKKYEEHAVVKRVIITDK